MYFRLVFYFGGKSDKNIAPTQAVFFTKPSYGMYVGVDVSAMVSCGFILQSANKSIRWDCIYNNLVNV